MDAVIFKGDKTDSARIDFFCIIPNKTLHFTNTGESHVAKYELIVNITDSLNNKVVTHKYDKIIKVKEYTAAQSANGEFSKIQEQYYLPAGNYKIKTILHDSFSKNEYEKGRNMTLVNFSEYPISSSGILLVSAIEENEKKFIITPHISDNIGTLQSGYFAFFELYNSLHYNEVSIHSEIIDNETKEVIYSDNTVKNIKDSATSQIYIHFPNTINYGRKLNTLKITIYPASKNAADNNDILAVTQRSIRNVSHLLSKISANLDDAIRQMRYVASNSEFKSIKEAKNDKDKLKRFEDFWRKFDPTPNTERNEALEEYYYRIDYANKNFKSYTEGWLTDKGHVFVVYGPPNAVDRSSSSAYSTSTVYEKWTYYNNRVFIFYDATGFGDFRLSSPSVVSELYEYHP